MKGAFYSLIPAVVICGVLATSINAAPAAASLYVKGISEVAHEIHDLMSYTSSELCRGDLDIASAYVESAEISLRGQKIPETLISIDKGIHELTEISTNRAYCLSIAQNTKHVLADLIRTRAEIETWMRLKLMSRLG